MKDSWRIVLNNRVCLERKFIISALIQSVDFEMLMGQPADYNG